MPGATLPDELLLSVLPMLDMGRCDCRRRGDGERAIERVVGDCGDASDGEQGGRLRWKNWW